MCFVVGKFILNFVNRVSGEPPVGLSPSDLSFTALSWSCTYHFQLSSHVPDMHSKFCTDLFNYHQVHVRRLSCRLAAVQEVGILHYFFYYFWSTTY